MSQLTPCPACRRHVRKTETTCPFCSASISLAHVAPPVLPSSRLGRAATFAFGASLVGATALVSCSSDEGPGTAVYGGPPVPSAGAGGDATDVPEGGSGGTGAGTAIYGSPPSAGAGGAEQPDGGDGGAGGGSGEGGAAGVVAIYGGPPAGAGGGI